MRRPSAVLAVAMLLAACGDSDAGGRTAATAAASDSTDAAPEAPDEAVVVAATTVPPSTADASPPTTSEPLPVASETTAQSSSTTTQLEATATVPAGVPTLPPFAPPSKESLLADSDPHCEYLYGLVTTMDLGSNFPNVAKGIGRDDGTGVTVGCEMYFDDVRDYVTIREGTFKVAWVSTPLPHRQPTDDPDEIAQVLSSGATVLVDPTGDDGQGYDDVRVVSLVQPDGSIGFVMGFKGTSLAMTIAIADELDRAIRAAA